MRSIAKEIAWIDTDQLGLKEHEDCVDWLSKQENPNRLALESLPRVSPQTSTLIIFSHKKSRFLLKEDGVYITEHDHEQWLCSKLEVTALARDQASENWGRLLFITDADNQVHLWTMPMTLLKGSGEELYGELLRLGLVVAPGLKNRHALVEYIATARPATRARSVNRIGWHHNVFVLPQRFIGVTHEHVLYQSDHYCKHYQKTSTLESWRNEVAKYCIGNSRLILAVSCAFAAILLHLVNAESGGLHLVGESSTGKTTALRVAASVFGPPEYLQRWRATTNGIEALAYLHNDTLLILDEIAQVDPREAGEIAYMLANGSGKHRANKTGSAKASYEWRLLFLSAGEVGLVQHMKEGGKKTKAGQEVRLVNIPADAGAGLGVFEMIHNFDSPAALSRHLNTATAQHYGTALEAFLEMITHSNKFASLSQKIKQFCSRFVKEYLPANASGQVSRVCDRFALIAAAGEMASHYTITGWPLGEAKMAAYTCFKAWLEQRGTLANQETKSILSQVRAFFEAHGESRFTDWDNHHSKTINRAGFRKQSDSKLFFYVLPECFRNEICSGIESRSATKTLIQAGWLQTDPSGTPYQREYLPLIGRSRCYVFTNKMWEE